ncbi:adenosylcobinamide-phosphate synthase [Azonexus fungiphilus]|jgi:cobalamin biosynthesis protein CobD/CbiB|uniref:Cobalamin biosynthesis protein CobD n=1 Tax=Azonexus fungiphilus TaxID=146940 RepID=A0A495W8C2_9RHOO|nr:CobD/CbiB family protein [Azonexus fungiphilus]RKT58021.1 adenosylcobinamide-phosphate synthase [Azonexus fungiphilus]
MSLFSLIAVFLIEQFKPLDYRRIVAEPLSAWAAFVESRFNAGGRHHGLAAWMIAVAVPVVLLAIVYLALHALNPLLGWVLNVGVLYLTMGFRQFSHHYTEIQLALRLGDLERARLLLGEWQDRPTQGLSAGDVARLAIEGALGASHRHVFAVLLWFVLLPGPCGALLYRLALIVRDRWTAAEAAEHNEFASFARQAFAVIDWLPQRTTAAAFAVVGDFEDAVHCWRTQPAFWPERELGIVLASGAGALGVRLGGSVIDEGEVADRAELGLGDPADVDFMQSAVGLVWRATVLWMLLLFLLGLASLAG